MNETDSGWDPVAMRAAVLRAWREDAGISLRELARRLGVAPGAVSMWETGQRARKSAPNAALVRDITGQLGLSPDGAQAMTDMWLAVGSITALKPRPYWAHNYQWPSDPGWVWLRCPESPATLSVQGWWSDPLQGGLQMDVGTGGVFVQFPKTIPNPPLEVTFDEPVGWADFGKGTISPGVAERLGALVVDAINLATPVKKFEDDLPGHMFARLNERKTLVGFKEVLDEKFGQAWDLIRPHFGIARFDRPPYPAANRASVRSPQDAGLRVDGAGWIISQPLIEPGKFREIRDARGLSRDAVASEVTAWDQDHPLTDPALRSSEENGVVPAVSYLLSRLDAAYGTDGWLGLDVMHDLRFRHSRNGIKFPRYWQGPIWLQVSGPDDGAAGLIELVWGPWRRRQYVHSGTVLRTRKAAYDMSPLIYEVPPGWQVRAGVGANPAGLDVNHGWYPKDIAAAFALLATHIAKVRDTPAVRRKDPTSIR